ncbi:MAG: hypothetical protein CEE38_15825 [Planctomycetes bacterium B3_Pla]|nr:MAG: hypothetical protein CEE38_15825 [Planctomycetes bacterium B3_Pla]
MEISDIAIRRFKGIEEVKLGPIRPINVLIGRNNSGKTSILTCIQTLSDYLSLLESKHERSIVVPDEYFNKRAGEDASFDISVTVVQTEEERQKQFVKLAKNWDSHYQNPKTSSDKIEIQLRRNLFRNLTFEFSALGKKFGLVAVTTMEEDGTERKDERVVVAESPHPTGDLKCLPVMELFFGGGYHRPEYFTLSDLREHQSGKTFDVKCGGPQFSAASPHGEVRLLNPAFQYVCRGFTSAFLVSPYRHGDAVMIAQRAKSINADGRNLVTYTHDLNLNNYEAFHRIAAFVKRIVPDVGRLHPRFMRAEGSELELAYEWPDGHVVNLANMGGGVEQLLILASLLIQQKTSCILWEEPESHLHPGAQDVLLSELETHVADSMVFMTTHSPVFVRSSDRIGVHIITNSDGKSGVGRTLSATELQDAATVLGSRPGHLAQADIVLYVEGKHGAAAFDAWLQKWPNKHKVLGHLLLVIQSCNPDEMGTDDFNLGNVKKVTPNMLLFLDKDNDPGSQEPKPARRKLLRMCEELEIPCVLTTKRQIEDYFTEEAVRKALPANLVSDWNYNDGIPLGEQFPNGWKKHNARIASIMEWGDIEKHDDIMQVFQKIEDYANKLKPETVGV